MNIKILILVYSSILISACTSYSIPYKPPTSGPTAKIKFINNSMRNLNISFFEESENCKKRRKASTVLPNTDTTITVQGNKDLSFEYYLTNRNTGSLNQESYCLVILRFKPIQNHEYIFETTENNFSCKWQLSNTTNQSNVFPVPLKVMEWKAVWSENSSFCEG